MPEELIEIDPADFFDPEEFGYRRRGLDARTSMSDLVPVSSRQLAAVNAERQATFRAIPSVRRMPAGASGNSSRRTSATGTRGKAYFVAVSQFSEWCEERKLALEAIQPIHVAAYIEQLMATRCEADA